MSKTKRKIARKAKKIDVNASLISAVKKGDLVSVKKLVHSYGLSYRECWGGNYVPLICAIELGHIQIAKFLLQKGAKSDCETDNVKALLHSSTRKSVAELIQLLLEKNMPVRKSERTKNNVRNKGVDVNSSLISTVSAGNLVSLKRLVNFHGLSHCECGNGNYVLLYVAIKLGHVETAKFLLQEGAKTFCQADVSTSPHLVTRQRLMELVRLLAGKTRFVKKSERTAKNVRAVNEIGTNSSLISAVCEGDLVSLKKLVHSRGLSRCKCENSGYVLLFVAIKLGHIEIAKFLLQEGAKPDCGIDNVSTPLHLATEQGYLKLVQLLLEKNVPVDVRNTQNETPLHLASFKGYAKIVKVLLSNNASVTVQSTQGLMPLFLAAKGRHGKVVQMLLNYASNHKLSTRTRNSTLLNHVLFSNPSIRDKVHELVVRIVTKDSGHSKIIDELIDHGYTLRRESLKEFFLLAAVTKNYIKLINSIFKSRTNCDDAKHYPQLLHAAVKIGSVEIAELFLKSGFNANATDERGATALCYSLHCKNSDKYVDIVRLLLANGANITKAPDLLHEAVSKGLIEVCKVLIESGANINALDTDGRTPLFLAVSQRKSGVAHEREGKKETYETTEDEIAELLLTSGADVNVSVRGYTALHHAVLNGRKKAVAIFLKSEVDIDIRAEDGSTPLFLASREGDTEIVELLCQNHADVNAGLGETSPLFVAARNRKVHVVEMLLKFGAVVNFEFGQVLCNNVETDDKDNGYGRLYISMFLSQHILKFRIAGLYAREWPCFTYPTFSGFYEHCEEEVKRLKNQRLNPRLTLYDVLTNSVRPTFAKRKLLMQKLESFNFSRFPAYKDVILSNLQKSKFRRNLMQSGRKWLDVLISTSNRLNRKKYLVMPVEILEQIVSLLSNSDIKSLIYCGEALKRQLSQ